MAQSQSTGINGDIDPNIPPPTNLPNTRLYVALDENNLVENCIAVEYSHRLLEYGDRQELYMNNVPAIGDTFDEELNAFIPPKPDDTYVLNTTTFEWEPPVA